MCTRPSVGVFLLLATTLASGCAGCLKSSVSEADGGASSSSSGGSSSGGANSSGGGGSSVGTSSGATSSGGTGQDGGTSGSSGAPGSSMGGRDAGPGVTALEVGPSPAQIDAVPGVGGQVSLTVTAVLADGSRRAANAPFFRSLNPEIGSMTSEVFHATGTRGGRATVRVRAEGLETQHPVDVTIRESQVDPGAPSGIDGQFGGPVGDPSTAPVMAYPLDQAVIPLNLSPILFQWRSTLAVYGYHLRIQGPHGTLNLYTSSDRVSALHDPWRRLLDSNSGETLTITLESVEAPGGTRHVAAQQTLQLARADLTATVYYWALNVGRIVAIDATSVSPNVLPLTGSVVVDPNTGATSECYACHTLSRDGTRLAFTFNGGNGPGGVVNPAAPSSNLLGPNGALPWNFAAISPDNQRMLVNYQKRLRVLDANTGADMPGVNPLVENAAHPAWAPTRDLVAYASSINAPLWEIDFTSSDITVQGIDPQSGALGSVLEVLPGLGSALYYPSFSPGGTHLIFNRGGLSRSMNQNVRYPATLEVADLMAGGTLTTVLARANPANDSHLATFSPFVEGGYMWVAFFSLRDYGLITSNKRQIWVTALDQNPTPGVDPSHPAFWLPGQDASTENMSSYFAPAPCVGAGASCTSDLGCCGGNLCRPNAGGALVCTPPDQACGIPGDPCTVDTDCCAGAGPCFDDGSGTKTCTPPELQCHAAGQPCQFDDDCCVGAGTCFGGTGTFVCTPTGMQCHANLQACVTSADCCPGAGDCLTNPATGQLACLHQDQTCRTPMQACTSTADCCPGMGVACLANASSGMLQCLRPTDQCRSEGQACAAGSSDCCAPLACDTGTCARVGG